MATFPGFKPATGSFLVVPDDNQDLGVRVPQQTQANLLEGFAWKTDPVPLIDNRPVALNTVVLPGHRTRTFFEDFYNRIHFIPAIVELGAVSSNTSVEVKIWNAYLKPVTLEEISFINQGGISIDGPAAPVVLIPLQTLSYNVEASSEGPASIDAQIVFSFDVEVFPLHVTGTRARISPFIPNWSSPFDIEYQFKTDIFTSRNGKEQRRALRTSPRKNVSFKAAPTHDRLRRARNMLAGWGNNTVIMPEVTREARLRFSMENSNFLILTGPAPSWIVPGQTVVVATRDLYEAREVVDVDGDSVQLAGSIPGRWPAGTKVHPGLSVRFADSISVRHLTDEAATVGVELEVIPGSERYQPTVAPRMFKGREVFLTKPNWIDPVMSTFESQREMVDYGRGRDALFTPIPFGTILQKLTYTGRNFDQSFALVEFFLRCRGQLHEFYMPTFVNDVSFSYPVPAGSRSLRIAGLDFFRDHEEDAQRKAVAIYMKNGDVFLRGVNTVAKVEDEIGSDSALDLDEDLPYALTMANVKKISWLPRWRMASDTFAMTWLTNNKADCQLSVRMLEDIPG